MKSISELYRFFRDGGFNPVLSAFLVTIAVVLVGTAKFVQLLRKVQKYFETPKE